jgi:hypothetical protein
MTGDKLGEKQRVRVAFDTIEWAAGIDLDPVFVYAKCQGLKVERHLESRRFRGGNKAFHLMRSDIFLGANQQIMLFGGVVP